MQHTPLAVVTQFAHVLQQELFPELAVSVGPLDKKLELLAAVVSMTSLGRMLSAHRSFTGRPAKDRTALATAFIAKAILNLPTTHDLISRLRVDAALRRFCGWYSADRLPHESKFSRAFAEFAASELPQQLHAAVVAATQSQRLIGHITRDSTAIPARERVPQAVLDEKKGQRREGKEEEARQAEETGQGQSESDSESQSRCQGQSQRRSQSLIQTPDQSQAQTQAPQGRLRPRQSH